MNPELAELEQMGEDSHWPRTLLLASSLPGSVGRIARGETPELNKLNSPVGEDNR